jgi:hypothetical protein
LTVEEQQNRSHADTSDDLGDDARYDEHFQPTASGGVCKCRHDQDRQSDKEFGDSGEGLHVQRLREERHDAIGQRRCHHEVRVEVGPSRPPAEMRSAESATPLVDGAFVGKAGSQLPEDRADCQGADHHDEKRPPGTRTASLHCVSQYRVDGDDRRYDGEAERERRPE